MIPASVIIPTVTAACVLGAYLETKSLFSVWLMVGFAVLGWVMHRYDYSRITFLIGFVVGPLFELAVRQSLIITRSDPRQLLAHPFALLLLACAIGVAVAFSIGSPGARGGRALTGASAAYVATVSTTAGATGSVEPALRDQPGEQPLVRHQLAERPALHDPPGIEHQDAVGVGDRGQPMRDDEGGAPGPQPVQRALDAGLGLDIERAGGLVEDQDGRILEDGARDGDALALAARTEKRRARR